MIMYTRNIDKKKGLKTIGIIDKQQQKYEQELKQKNLSIN